MTCPDCTAAAYRAALHALFGGDAAAGHAQVKKEYERIAALRNAGKH